MDIEEIDNVTDTVRLGPICPACDDPMDDGPHVCSRRPQHGHGTPRDGRT